MPFVLDASITASWFFPDEQTLNPESTAAWQRSADEQMLVPLHWWFEVRNALLIAERRRRISEQLTFNALARLSQLAIVAAPMPDGMDVLALARRHRLSFYDAVYLELAVREGIALATLDHDLAAAARSEGVALIGA